MIKGITLLEEFPVYDKFWMPLLYIILGLFVIAVTVITIYCCKNKWWFYGNTQRTTNIKSLNAMKIGLMYIVTIIASMMIMMITDIILTSCKFEGVKGDTVQYKVQVTNECSFIEFHNTFEIIEEYDDNIYLVGVKE